MTKAITTSDDDHDQGKNDKASSKGVPKGKIRRFGLPETEFQELKKRYANADPAIKAQVVNEIAIALYRDIYNAAKAKLRNCKEISPTSVTIVTYMKMLGYLSERGGDLGKYGTVGELMLLFQRGVHQVVVDKYRKLLGVPFGGRRVPTDRGPDEDGTPATSSKGGSVRPDPILPKGITVKTPDGEGGGFVVIDSRNWLEDLLTQDVAQRLFEILNEKLAPEELSILMMRYAEGMTYSEILEAMDDERTPDALRMQLKRLHESISKMPEVENLRNDFLNN
ncbi:MAG: hypothetical protein Q4G59_12380 [Planctomycetia bacterium]|nr:hypothetical protein [Planctomycetia bacterium]